MQQFNNESIRRRAHAHRLSEGGYSKDEIAEQTGVSDRHVMRYLSQTKPQLIPMRRNQTWRDDAACLNKPVEWFFPDAVGIKGQQQKLEAMRVCAECPVRQQCRETALANFETHGIWAGEDFSKHLYRINEETGEITILIRERRGQVEKIS